MNSVALGNVCNVTTGQSAPQEADAFGSFGTPFVRAGSLERLCNGENENTLELVAPEKAAKYRLKVFPKDTIVFAKSGMSAKVGRVHRLRRDCHIVSHLAAVIPSAKVDSGYLHRWFEYSPPSRLIENDAYPSIKTSTLEKIEIPLPSLPEQRRIAAILDKADALRAKRREAIAKLDQLLQSMFLDTFGNPTTNPHGFKLMGLGEVASQVTDGAHHTPVRDEQGIPLLSARNVLMGSIDFSNTDFVGQDEYERLRKRCEPTRGDVLISCSGSIGRVARVLTDRPFVLVRSAALVKLKAEDVTPAFVEYQLRTPFLQAQMQRSAKSSSQANLFQKPIRELQIMVAPLPLQRKFESLVSEVQMRRNVLVESERRHSDLFASLQNAAFQGIFLQ